MAVKREVTRTEYFRELGLLSGKIRRRRALRSEYYSLMGRIGALARTTTALIRRIPYADIIEKVIIGTRIRTLDSERTRLLTQMRHIRTTELPILEEDIGRERREFALKIVPPPPPPPPVKELGRVSLNLYLIIEAGEHEYPRQPERYYHYRKPRPRRVRVKRPYPKGAFQSWLECDAFLDSVTREILQDEEPFPTLLTLMREDVAREFEEEFSLSHVDPDTLTLGEVSEIASPEEIGKPPYKIRVERTVEARPGETWSTPVERYLLTDEEYDELTKDMKQYRKALEEMP